MSGGFGFHSWPARLLFRAAQWTDRTLIKLRLSKPRGAVTKLP